MSRCLISAVAAALLQGARVALASQDTPIVGYQSLFKSDVDEVPEKPLQGDASLPGAPSWLEGTFMVGGAHGQELNGYKLQHTFDGFTRLLRFSVRRGAHDRPTCTLHMKMLPSAYWNTSKEQGFPVAAMTFGDTEPSKNASFLKRLSGPADNCFVQQSVLGDKYLGSTDDTQVITYNEELDNFQRIKWQDDVEGRLYQAMQVAHGVVLAGSTKLVGLLSEMPYVPMMHGRFTIYQVDAQSPSKREELASMDVPSTSYQHSFGLGGDLAVICDHPWKIDNAKMLTQGSYVLDAMKIDHGGNTTFRVVNLTSKATESFVVPAYMILHFTNVFANEVGDIIFDQPTWRGCNPYDMFKRSVVEDAQQLDAFRSASCENVLRRFVLHRSGPARGTASTEVLDAGWFEFPQFNQLWRGKQSCFLYLTEWYHSKEYADMAIVKFDTCKRQRTEWKVRGHFPLEPKFVPRPQASEEDDGVVVSVVMDGAAQTSYLLVLDAKRMEPLERFSIGRPVPFVTHGVWKFPGAMAAAPAAEPEQQASFFA